MEPRHYGGVFVLQRVEMLLAQHLHFYVQLILVRRIEGFLEISLKIPKLHLFRFHRSKMGVFLFIFHRFKVTYQVIFWKAGVLTRAL